MCLLLLLLSIFFLFLHDEICEALGSMENGEILLHDVFKTCMVKTLDQFHDFLDVLKDFRFAISSKLASNTIKPGGESMTKKKGRALG